MTINANDKIINAIEEQLPRDEAKKETLREERAVELFYTLPSFYEEKQMLEKWKRMYLQYGIDSYTYSNGLTLLKSYMVLNGEYVINQTIITDNLKNINSIASIRTKLEWKALQQFLIESKSDNAIFGYPTNNNDDRNIEVIETAVEMKGKCIGKFTRIKKKGENTVYAETYKAVSMVSKWKTDSYGIADICCNGELEILYRYDDIPVFANISTKNKEDKLLKDANTTSFHNSEAKFFVNRVCEEVDEIIEEIKVQIANYEADYGNKEFENKVSKEAWIDTMQRVSSRLTPSARIKFMKEYDAEIKEKMQRILEEEKLSELQTYLEEEHDDFEEINMILGNNSMEHISEMIREDFNEDGEKETQSTPSGKVLMKKRDMEKRLELMRKRIRKDFEEDE